MISFLSLGFFYLHDEGLSVFHRGRFARGIEFYV